MKHERTCIVCGSHYSYCSRCKEYNPKETWRYIFCNENCRDIFNVVSDYSGKVISIDEAKEMLSDNEIPRDYNSKTLTKLKEIVGDKRRISKKKREQVVDDISETISTKLASDY